MFNIRRIPEKNARCFLSSPLEIAAAQVNPSTLHACETNTRDSAYSFEIGNRPPTGIDVGVWPDNRNRYFGESLVRRERFQALSPSRPLPVSVCLPGIPGPDGFQLACDDLSYKGAVPSINNLPQFFQGMCRGRTLSFRRWSRFTVYPQFLWISVWTKFGKCRAGAGNMARLLNCPFFRQL